MLMKISAVWNCARMPGEAKAKAASPSSRWKAASCCSMTPRMAPRSTAVASSPCAGATIRRAARTRTRRIGMGIAPPPILSHVNAHLVAGGIGKRGGGEAEAARRQAHIAERADDALDIALGRRGVADGLAGRRDGDDVERRLGTAIEGLLDGGEELV